MTLRMQARAKINWTLDVLGRRPDGYHELDMLMQSVTLHDTLTLDPAAELSLTMRGNTRLRADERNLALRAARALKAAAGTVQGARMTLKKRIPTGAGMGGGSADAAAALVGLNRLWALGLTDAELERVGLALGADVPFCVRGGLQRAGGVGEALTPLRFGRAPWLVVVQPCRGLSTREVFTALRAEDIRAADRPRNADAAAALAAGDLAGLAAAMGNALQPTAVALRPAIGRCVERVAAQGAVCAQMTGSGSAVFGAYPSEQAACAAYQALRAHYRAIWVTVAAEAGIVTEES